MSYGYFLEDLQVGMSAELQREILQKDVDAFAELTGDYNPVHIDEEYAANTMFKGRIVHGAYIASMFSTIMGIQLPGHGSIFREITLNYRGPVRVGDTALVRVEISEINLERQIITLSLFCKVNGKKVVRGKAGAWVAQKPDD
jgi:3-hydroxybutyryl-CoA dehydratase